MKEMRIHVEIHGYEGINQIVCQYSAATLYVSKGQLCVGKWVMGISDIHVRFLLERRGKSPSVQTGAQYKY